MTAIVMNTLNGAVTEYSNFAVDSMTQTHVADAGGLYTLGGTTDVATEIIAEVVTGKVLWGDSRKKMMDMVYFSMAGEGKGELIVQGQANEWRYPFPVRATGQSRQQPGRGIRENYLAFGFSNPDGDDFRIDRIEVSVLQSKTRRVG